MMTIQKHKLQISYFENIDKNFVSLRNLKYKYHSPGLL